MSSKQTAVEWLMANLTSLFVDDSGHYKKLFEQAKAMEKEQIEDAFQDGKWDWSEHIKKGSESKDLAQYYQENYG